LEKKYLSRSWEDNIKMYLREISCEAGSTGSCCLKSFNVSCIKRPDFSSRTFTKASHVSK
jgi:hypothetical protein